MYINDQEETFSDKLARLLQSGQPQTTEEVPEEGSNSSWLKTIQDALLGGTAEAAPLQKTMKAQRLMPPTPAATPQVTPNATATPNDKGIVGDVMGLFNGNKSPTPAPAKNPIKPIATKQVTQSFPGGSKVTPGTQQIQDQVPVEKQGSSTSQVVSTERKDPTETINALYATATPSMKAKEAELTGMEDFIKGETQAREEKKARGSEDLKAYMNTLDRNQKADFWQNIIKALGQVASGVAGNIIGAPVAKYYQPIDVFDKKGMDANAKEKLSAQQGISTEMFDAAMEKLKSTRDLARANAVIAPQVQANIASQKAGVLKEAMPTVKTVDSKNKTAGVDFIYERPNKSEAGKQGKVDYTQITGQETNKEHTDNILDFRNKKALSGTKSLRPEGNNYNEQADNFGRVLEDVTGKPQEAFSRYYLLAAKRLKDKSGVNPTREDTAAEAHRLIDQSFSPPKNLQSKEYFDWYNTHVGSGTENYTPVIPHSTVQFQAKPANGESYIVDYTDPYDVNNVKSYYNMVIKPQLEKQKATGINK